MSLNADRSAPPAGGAARDGADGRGGRVILASSEAEPMRASFLFLRRGVSAGTSFSLFTLTAALLAGALLGCGGPEPTSDAGTDAALPDADPTPDGARFCTTDEECLDDVTCTREHCDTVRGYCVVNYDVAMCDDGVYCNGIEQCDPREGCVPGSPNTCNDGDVCTIDRCNEAMRTCEHSARDLDEDGDVDFFCDGGGDCDDRDPARSSIAPEICDDLVDQDCDGLDDDASSAGMCGRPPNDACDDPLDVSAGGSFLVNTAGASSDYTVGCIGSPQPDLVLTFTTTEPHDVEIAAEGDFDVYTTALALRTSCADRATESECDNGHPAMIRRRALPAGTYFVIVTGFGAGEIAIDVTFSDPTDPPANEACAGAIDVSAGGTFHGSMLDVADDLDASCPRTSTALPDLVYTFTTTTERDVRVSAVATTGEPMSFEIRPTCDSSVGNLRCVSGSPAATRLHQLPAGTYFILLEGPSYAEVDFQLDVEFLDPTPVPAGDVCGNAIPLTLGTRTTGSLVGLEDDLDTTCGFDYPEAVYSFTITERRDVLVEVDAGTSYFNASVRPSCADSATQLRCSAGAPIRQRFRDIAPGTYFVIVESSRAGTFAITVTDSAPTPTTVVSGNDGCDTAYVVPATGGFFTGNTAAMTNDYTTAVCGANAGSRDVAFQIDLTSRQRVVASTEGSSFDTVIYMMSPTCLSGFDMFCSDDAGGVWSLIDQTLDPGTYYLAVDGYGTASAGAYALEVQITDPT